MRAKILAKFVVEDCKRCPLLLKKHLKQRMADLPSERLQVLRPPFTSISLDYFGPYEIRDMRNPPHETKSVAIGVLLPVHRCCAL